MHRVAILRVEHRIIEDRRGDGCACRRAFASGEEVAWSDRLVRGNAIRHDVRDNPAANGFKWLNRLRFRFRSAQRADAARPASASRAPHLARQWAAAAWVKQGELPSPPASVTWSGSRPVLGPARAAPGGRSAGARRRLDARREKPVAHGERPGGVDDAQIQAQPHHHVVHRPERARRHREPQKHAAPSGPGAHALHERH